MPGLRDGSSVRGRREEGTLSEWLYEVLEPHVEELVVAGVRESRGPKSDKVDAFELAEQLRVGSLETMGHSVRKPQALRRCQRGRHPGDIDFGPQSSRDPHVHGEPSRAQRDGLRPGTTFHNSGTRPFRRP
jgi:hypothetical protein